MLVGPRFGSLEPAAVHLIHPGPPSLQREHVCAPAVLITVHDLYLSISVVLIVQNTWID